MKARCLNPTDHNYPFYGGRGITVCKDWKEDYLTFKKWATTNGYADNLTIDRRDNNRGYEPENCRWATRAEQTRNTRRTRLTAIQAKTIREMFKTGQYSQKELSKILAVSPTTIWNVVHYKTWNL